MNDGWQPLLTREAGVIEELREGVPVALETPLREWIWRASWWCSTISIRRIALRLDIALDLVDQHPDPSVSDDRQVLAHESDIGCLLDITDGLLSVLPQRDPASTGACEKLRGDLMQYLEDSRSVYEINADGTGLERRGAPVMVELKTEARGMSLASPITLSGHAFISYAREDADHADRLQEMLEVAGVPVWRDTADLWPGQDWREEIRRAISCNALVFLACFSNRSVARKASYQNEELVLAIEQLRQRRPEDPWLIPVRFDDCKLPDRDLGGGRMLSSIQRADLFGDRSDEGVARLLAAVTRILTNTNIP